MLPVCVCSLSDTITLSAPLLIISFIILLISYLLFLLAICSQKYKIFYFVAGIGFIISGKCRNRFLLHCRVGGRQRSCLSMMLFIKLTNISCKLRIIFLLGGWLLKIVLNTLILSWSRLNARKASKEIVGRGMDLRYKLKATWLH